MKVSLSSLRRLIRETVRQTLMENSMNPVDLVKAYIAQHGDLELSEDGDEMWLGDLGEDAPTLVSGYEGGTMHSPPVIYVTHDGHVFVTTDSPEGTQEVSLGEIAHAVQTKTRLHA